MGNIIFLLLVLGSFYGLSKLFVKAGEKGWKGWIPVYNFYILARLLGKPWWWCLIMIVPGVNIIMYGVYGFMVARAFNKPSNGDLLFASLLPYIFFIKIGHDPTAKYVGLDRYQTEPIRFIRNWVDPIIFAVIAASIIRGYFIEAFTIPTSSLEKSLLVGDFLFVNKFAYGPKIPQTPLSFPFAHHTFPGTATTKSYLEWIKLPYFRLPGFGKVRNNQIVVFNYPDGDTVALKQQNSSYYEIVRQVSQESQYKDSDPARAYQEGWHYVHSNPEQFGEIIGRPIDKRDHYVKRCVGIGGDTIRIVNGDVFISGVKQNMPVNAQHNYFVKARTNFITANFLDAMDIYVDEAYRVVATDYRGKRMLLLEHILRPGQYVQVLENYPAATFEKTLASDTTLYCLNMTEQTAAALRNDPNIVQVSRRIDNKASYSAHIFPHKSTFPWNNDNFGPLLIPREGMTIPIDTANLCLYRKIIDTYDDGIHYVTVSGSQVLYDGKPITSYTFRQNYYFMMGDNRHNSADSRSWGFVPYDHIVGSPFFVWFSMKYEEKNPVSGKSIIGSVFKNSKDGKFRWERFLCYVKDGTLHSVKIPFLLIVGAIWGFSKWNGRRKKLKSGQASAK